MRSEVFGWRAIYDIVLSLYEVGSLKSVSIWSSGELEPFVEIHIKNLSITSRLIYCIDPGSVAKLTEKLNNKLPKELIRGVC
jgi:hypothetical protein